MKGTGTLRGVRGVRGVWGVRVSGVSEVPGVPRDGTTDGRTLEGQT